MSFDVDVFFRELPADAKEQWQSLLSSEGLPLHVDIPPDGTQAGTWHLRDAAVDAAAPDPDDAWAVDVSAVTRESLAAEGFEGDALERLSAHGHRARLSLALRAGTTVLLAAGTLAKVTRGVVWDPQVAAFDEPFDARLAAVRGPRGPAGRPTLEERGIYEADVAMGIARVYREAERRTAPAAAASLPPPPRLMAWRVFAGIFGAMGVLGAALMALAKVRLPFEPVMLYPLLVLGVSAFLVYSTLRLAARRGRLRSAQLAAAVGVCTAFHPAIGVAALGFGIWAMYSAPARAYFEALPAER